MARAFGRPCVHHRGEHLLSGSQVGGRRLHNRTPPVGLQFLSHFAVLRRETGRAALRQPFATVFTDDLLCGRRQARELLSVHHQRERSAAPSVKQIVMAGEAAKAEFEHHGRSDRHAIDLALAESVHGLIDRQQDGMAPSFRKVLASISLLTRIVCPFKSAIVAIGLRLWMLSPSDTKAPTTKNVCNLREPPRRSDE